MTRSTAISYDDLQADAQARGLRVLGGFHPVPEDAAPKNCKTLVLLGPDEPRFWPLLNAAPEWSDGLPDPVDRWSARVIGGWAADISAQALFPFGGPPYAPFIAWGTRTGRISASPAGLLVHDRAGLFLSFRGALALDWQVDLPPSAPTPCNSCDGQPCRTACPVNALTGSSYDVEACKAHLATTAGQDCLTLGCRARHACPISRKFGRLPAQSAYHMMQFKG